MTTPNFNRVARIYNLAEHLTFGPALQRARTHFIPQLVAKQSALVLGDGDGRFLAALLRTHPHIAAHAVDASPTMLALLRARCAPHTVTTTCADIRTFTPHTPHDLIATHFFLDCLTTAEVAALAQTLATHSPAQTHWLITEFRIPTGPLNPIARALIRSLYAAFNILTNLNRTALPNYAEALTAAGFTRTHRHLSLFGLLTSELWRKT